MEYLKLDWLSFTFKGSDIKTCDPFLEFLNAFKIDSSELTDGYYRTTYQNVSNLKGIWICHNFYDPFKIYHMNDKQLKRLTNMGVHVSIPSSALSYFFNRYGLDYLSENALYDVIKFLKDKGCKISRLDLCYDDFTKKFSVEYYRQKWVDEVIQSPFINSVSCIGSTKRGLTFYIGSHKARQKLLRIYDKFKESNGQIDSIRYEFELHSDGADEIANQIIDKKDLIRFSDFIAKWLLIKDIQSVCNCKRIQDAKNDDEWYNWILALNDNLTLRYVKLSRPKLVDDDDIFKSLQRSCLRQVSGYVKCYGFDSLERLIDDCIANNDITDRFRNLYERLLEVSFVPMAYCDNPFDSEGDITTP